MPKETTSRRHPLRALITSTVAIAALVATLSPAAAAPTVERISGEDRYATASKVAHRHYKKGAGVTYVALGTDFPDALAGAPAAVSDGGPILLSRSTDVTKTTKKRLTALDPTEVYVLGGSKVMKNSAVNEIKELLPGAKVSRVAGTNRYETSVAISEANFATGVKSVFIVNGEDFPDALTAGPIAGIEASPVLLAKSGSIPQSVRTELTRLDPGEIFVLGGKGAISAKVLKDLQDYTDGKVTRLDGANRFDTAVSVSERWFPDGSKTVYLATGADFPDALAGGPAGALDDAPILLIKRDSVPNSVLTEIKRLKPTKIIVLGGKNVITNKAVNQIVKPSKPGSGSDSSSHPTPQESFVKPGALCARADIGKTAKSKNGVTMVCSLDDDEARQRWRAV